MTHRQYTIVVERAEGNYSAYAPDLPGVVAAADTVDETERLMREAIALYLEELRAAGEPIPEPTSIARTVEVVA
jgi:predicted RNase H-like HicB family nuclease